MRGCGWWWFGGFLLEVIGVLFSLLWLGWGGRQALPSSRKAGISGAAKRGCVIIWLVGVVEIGLGSRLRGSDEGMGERGEWGGTLV